MTSWQDYLGLLGYGTAPGGILGAVDLAAIKAATPNIGPVAPDPADNGDFWSTKNPDGTTSILGGLFNYDPNKDIGRGDRLGLFGATLADAGAQFGGHPEAAVNLSRYDANRKQQAGQALLMDALNGATGTPAAIPAQTNAIGAPLGAGGGLATQGQAATTSWNAHNPGPTSGAIHIPPGSDHPEAPDPTHPSELPPGIPPLPSQLPAPTPTGFNLRDMLPKLAKAAAAGVDVAPIVSLLKDAQPKYSQDVHWTGDGKPYVMADDGSPKFLDPSVTPREKREIVNGQAVDPFAIAPGTVIPLQNDFSKPINPGTGAANTSAQEYERKKIAAEQGPAWANNRISADRLAFERSKYEAGIPDEAALHDMAVRYVKMGDKTAFGPMGRNPRMQTAAQNMITQVGRELGLRPEQISQNQQTFAAGAKAVAAFDTGKQGDTVRSLNVSVAHLDTLRQFGKALENGDVNLINAARQKFAEAFGVAAPTNWDAAKSIVADEIAKGVIGGQSAQQDRETLAASLKRSRSPSQIDGAIGGFQELLGGQLRGLRQQYKSSTGRDDFNDKLFPETVQRLDPPKKTPPPSPNQLPRVAPPGGTSSGVKWRIVPQGGR